MNQAATVSNLFVRVFDLSWVMGLMAKADCPPHWTEYLRDDVRKPD